MVLNVNFKTLSSLIKSAFFGVWTHYLYEYFKMTLLNVLTEKQCFISAIFNNNKRSADYLQIQGGKYKMG